MIQSNFVDKLQNFFSEEAEDSIELVYLFGSRASGSEGTISDYDIAVLFSIDPPYERKYELAHQLAGLLSTDRVDLVALNRAPIELRYAVIATGMVLYERNAVVRIEFESDTLSRYGDYLPVLRRQRKEILEEHKNETGVQRYREALGKTRRLLEKIRAV